MKHTNLNYAWFEVDEYGDVSTEFFWPEVDGKKPDEVVKMQFESPSHTFRRFSLVDVSPTLKGQKRFTCRECNRHDSVVYRPWNTLQLFCETCKFGWKDRS